MKNPIFDVLVVRDPQKAFKNAKFLGMRKPEDWMYMESDKWFDHFKHHGHRGYKSFINFNRKGLMTMKQWRELYERNQAE